METFDFERRVFGSVSGSHQRKPKRKSLTSGQRLYVWEHPKRYGRICSICHEKIAKLSELELDHARAHVKGGTKLALAHRDCNRLKSSGSLKQIQEKLGIKTKKRKRVKKKQSAHQPWSPFSSRSLFAFKRSARWGL